MRLRWPWSKKEPPQVFTGNCFVRQHTMDRIYVGRCYHSTYNGVCPLHGDVTIYLDDLAAWPRDYELREIQGFGGRWHGRR